MQDPAATRDRGAGYLFVYGTLRRGAPMHGLLSEGLRYVGRAQASGQLYDMGAYPALVEASPPSKVRGEIFEFVGEPSGVLEVLDRYEGEFFERVVRGVELDPEPGHAPRQVMACMYRFNGDLGQGRQIEDGDYVAFLARNEPRRSPRD